MKNSTLISVETAPCTWLVTGVAGFIGSNVAELLLRNGQQVIGLDNFSTGHPKNLRLVQESVGNATWENFKLLEGDIRDTDVCRKACSQVTRVIHLAAQISVPRSMSAPLETDEINVRGFLNMLDAACRNRIISFVYATSSAVYGNNNTLPLHEDTPINCLSPYALSKYFNEMYAAFFASRHSLNVVGLRFFNVYGNRQDPHGAYAAVIPQWFSDMLQERQVTINGTGETTRDFCHINDVVSALVLASLRKRVGHRIYNIATGRQTSLLELFQAIRQIASPWVKDAQKIVAFHAPFRDGDVLHSVADISRASRELSFVPYIKLSEGLMLTAQWYKQCYEQKK